jgi:hypothetical protein
MQRNRSGQHAQHEIAIAIGGRSRQRFGGPGDLDLVIQSATPRRRRNFRTTNSKRASKAGQHAGIRVVYLDSSRSISSCFSMAANLSSTLSASSSDFACVAASVCMHLVLHAVEGGGVGLVAHVAAGVGGFAEGARAAVLGDQHVALGFGLRQLLLQLEQRVLRFSTCVF